MKYKEFRHWLVALRELNPDNQKLLDQITDIENKFKNDERETFFYKVPEIQNVGAFIQQSVNKMVELDLEAEVAIGPSVDISSKISKSIQYPPKGTPGVIISYGYFCQLRDLTNKYDKDTYPTSDEQRIIRINLRTILEDQNLSFKQRIEKYDSYITSVDAKSSKTPLSIIQNARNPNEFEDSSRIFINRLAVFAMAITGWLPGLLLCKCLNRDPLKPIGFFKTEGEDFKEKFQKLKADFPKESPDIKSSVESTDDSTVDRPIGPQG